MLRVRCRKPHDAAVWANTKRMRHSIGKKTPHLLQKCYWVETKQLNCIAGVESPEHDWWWRVFFALQTPIHRTLILIFYSILGKWVVFIYCLLNSQIKYCEMGKIYLSCQQKTYQHIKIEIVFNNIYIWCRALWCTYSSLKSFNRDFPLSWSIHQTLKVRFESQQIGVAALVDFWQRLCTANTHILSKTDEDIGGKANNRNWPESNILLCAVAKSKVNGKCNEEYIFIMCKAEKSKCLT